MPTKEIVLTPEEAFNPEVFQNALYKKMGMSPDGDMVLNPIKRSIDARSKNVCVRVQVDMVPVSSMDKEAFEPPYQEVGKGKPVIIIGAGPAGLFAALRLIELGVKPIVLERGKDVQSRRRDIAAINKEHLVNPDSNYCFGEGGAGTFSDGKLYTRSKKRGDVTRILKSLVYHGAHGDIRFDAHPHIGTNKLPNIIASIRKAILDRGGEIHFNVRVSDFRVEGDRITEAIDTQGGRWKGESFLLATGHSARDIFGLLHGKGISLEAKPFALGVRVEHAQALIDTIQYHCTAGRGPWLPASPYSWAFQTNGKDQRGVYSFCMCPGGFIVPSATAPGEVVVNGMSPSRRDSPFANSGIVVEIKHTDFSAYQAHGPLAGLYFQQEVERRACEVAGQTQTAPAQRLVDFVEGRTSTSLLPTSYQPGLASVPMGDVLPPFIISALRQGFKEAGNKMRGYLTQEAQIVGVESRTSSPVRIPRDLESLNHPQLKNLYPCGEGAGYAGGIMSAAMDGERCAEAIAQKIK